MCDWEALNFTGLGDSVDDTWGGLVSCPPGNTTTAPPDTMANMPPLTAYPEYVAATIIQKYNLWILWAVGMLSNTAALLTVGGMKPFSPVFIYIASLAISDTFYLTIKLIYEQLKVQVKYLGVFGCSPLLYFLHLSGKFSHWTVLLMTIERMVAVWFPLKISSVSTKKSVSLAVLALALFQAFVNCHYLFSNQQITRGGGITCSTKPEFKDFRTKTLWVFFTLSSIIPCGGVLTMNSMIAFKLFQLSRTRQKMSESKPNKNSTNQTKKVTTMLFTISTAFLLLVTPGPIFYMYSRYWNYSVSLYQTAIFNLVREVINVCINADHAINFFLYFLSGTKFRKSFLDLVRCRTPGKSSISGSQSKSNGVMTLQTRMPERSEAYTTNNE